MSAACVVADCTYSASEGSAYCTLHGVKWDRGNDPWCDWCGRAIKLDGWRWRAVKAIERGYPPFDCDANPEDGIHEPTSDAATTVTPSTTDGSRAANSPSAQEGSTP